MTKQYLYPQNMKTKQKLWIWSIKDVIIVGIAAVPAILSAVKLGFYIPAALVAIYAFLSIRMDDQSVLDYINRAVRFFMTDRIFLWKEGTDRGKKNQQYKGSDWSTLLFPQRNHSRERQRACFLSRSAEQYLGAVGNKREHQDNIPDAASVGTAGH